MRSILLTALLALTALAGCTEVQERYEAIIEPERRPRFLITTHGYGESREEACAYALQPAQYIADLYNLRLYNQQYGGIQLDLKDECECHSLGHLHGCSTKLAVRE